MICVMQQLERLPVVGGHAVKGQAGQIVALVMHVAPRVTAVLAQQARGIVLGVALDEDDLASPTSRVAHAPPTASDWRATW